MKRTLLLTGLVAALLFLTLPKGMVYGSNMDWLSQHAALAETIRDACRAQQTLLPQVLPLGGGTNGFEFSYYGFLRPDSYRMSAAGGPDVPDFDRIYVRWLSRVGAAVLFLRRELKNDARHFSAAFYFCVQPAFFTRTGRSCLSTICRFSVRSADVAERMCTVDVAERTRSADIAERMCTADIAERTRSADIAERMCTADIAERTCAVDGAAQTCRACSSFLALAYCNSFYYVAVMLAAVGWYSYRREGKKFWSGYLVMVAGSGGLAAVLLLPSLLVILEHKRETAAALSVPLFLPKLGFLLYSPYGWNDASGAVPAACGTLEEGVPDGQSVLSAACLVRVWRMAVKRNALCTGKNSGAVCAAVFAAWDAGIPWNVARGDEMAGLSFHPNDDLLSASDALR